MARRSLSIRSKVVSITVALVLLSLCVSGGFFFATYYNALLMNTYQNLNTAVSQVQGTMASGLDSIDNMAFQAFSSDAIRLWLKNELSFPAEDLLSFSTISQMKMDIQMMLIFNSSWTSKHISAIHLYADGRDIELISRSYVPQEVFARAKARADDVEGFTFFLGPDGENGDVYFVKRINNMLHTKKMVLICAISQDAFAEPLGLFGGDVIANVTDETGMVFFSNRPEMVGTQSPFNPEQCVPVGNIPDAYEMKSPQGDQFVVYRTIHARGLNIMISQPQSAIIRQTLESMGGYIWVVLATLAVLTAISFLVAAAYTRFINSIIDSLNQVRSEHYCVRMPRYKDAQLNLISETFNHMTDEIETLINKVYRSNLLLRESDIKLLQSQMNPHFLVNTLTTIGTGALMRGEIKTHEAITALCGLLSENLYSLTDSGFATVQSELRYVQLYLYLQRMRFSDRLKYTITIEEDWLEGCYIPRLSLEPIVENAIVHGLESSEGQGCVCVEIKREDGLLLFIVTDNGVGFDTASLLTAEANRPGHNIGLKNTDKRLKYIFGEQYGIHIDSAPGAGTTVRISMPVLTSPPEGEMRGDAYVSGIDRRG